MALAGGDKQHHILCGLGEVARYVFLPGDPARAEAIAGQFDDAQEIARNREYVTFTGTYKGVLVSVTSTGIGCPSLAIAVEELVRIGADTLIRVGTGGAMQPDIMPGHLIVGTGAIRDEGTSRAYMPIEFPAVSDHQVAASLARAAGQSGKPWHLGVIHSKDSFYGQKEPDRMPIAEQIKSQWRAWVQGGALLSEMETATLFVLGSVLGVRTGSVCVAAANDEHGVRLKPGEEHDEAIRSVVTCALEAVVDLESRTPGTTG